MSELIQLLTGAKPYPIPACAVRPMPMTEFDDDDDEYECSCCHAPNLTISDFYINTNGRVYSRCKKCFKAAKNAKRRTIK